MSVIQPVSMKSAVIRPQAMKAPMLGSTMFDRKVPNRWTCSRIPPLRAAGCVVVAMTDPPELGSATAIDMGSLGPGTGDHARVIGVTMICVCLYIDGQEPGQDLETNMFTERSTYPGV